MRLVFDIETNGLMPEVNTIHMIVTRDLDTNEPKVFLNENIKEGLEYLSQASLLVAHNGIKYDIPVLTHLTGWVPSESTVVHDTMVIARLVHSNLKANDYDKYNRMPEWPKGLMAGSHSLKSWGLRLGNHKGDYEGGWDTCSQEMIDYCVQDTEVTKELYEYLDVQGYSKEAIDLEHHFASVIYRQEEYGFKLDIKAAQGLYDSLREMRTALTEELTGLFEPRQVPMKTPQYYEYGTHKAATKTALKELLKAQGIKPKEYTGQIKEGPLKYKVVPFNPSSRSHIAERLIEVRGWKPKVMTAGGKPQVDEAILSGLLKKGWPEVPKLLEYLLVEKRIGQLAEGPQAWLKLERKGRLHGSVNTGGAVTGRCTHSHPNIAQVPSCSARFGAECRSLFTVGSGNVLVGCDASGLELRCLAHYMNDLEYTKELLDGDIHTANQLAAGLGTRDEAKRFIYAFLYGAGDKLIGSLFGKGPRHGKAVKAKFLAATPSLDRLITQVQSVASHRGYLKGLDGRHIPVRSPHAALNSLLQCAGAVVMKKALVLLDESLHKVKGKYEFVANVHDEFQIEVLKGHEEFVGEMAEDSIRRAGEALGMRCPLAGEYKVGASWAETH